MFGHEFFLAHEMLLVFEARTGFKSSRGLYIFDACAGGRRLGQKEHKTNKLMVANPSLPMLETHVQVMPRDADEEEAEIAMIVRVVT